MPTRAPYPFAEIEPHWQKRWAETACFRAAQPGESGSEKPKRYILDMFPYPSGSGLHVGHLEGYTATDIVARYWRMRGHNVLHPMGWDAFGLPAEQHAVQTGTHPRVTTKRNVDNFRRQIQAMGFSYDWSREIDTTDPKYFRWTQWIFLKLYEKGLAYVADAPVWYCPALGTVLANEEVLTTPEGPRSERGNHPVERRPMRQWMLRITAYAERLLRDLDLLEWPDSLKEMQRNWIGKSEGAEVDFAVAGSSQKITVYTTRPDTLFGATYVVLAPEHPLVSALVSSDRRDSVEKYRRDSAAKSDLERTELAKAKTGTPLGAFAINPVNGEKIPVWVADYVLASYGTGAVMAVPAHDERDFEFAQTFHLPVRRVIRPLSGKDEPGCYTDDGVNVDSGFLDGLKTPEAKARVIEELEKMKQGRRQVRYKLRDWLFSRQRYWGEPFPIVWRNGQPNPLQAKDLPLTLPELSDYQPSPTGEPPLGKADGWKNLPDGSVRELNTMPQWAGSCWYYLRFCDPGNQEAPWSQAAEKYWMQGGGVDLYVGGAEHAVLHLLYARFWHKVLFDCGLVSHPEPFRRLVNQGIILGEDNRKMSKSVGNVVNPDEVIAEHGADALRVFEMFMGPLEQMKPWSSKGMEGSVRFLARVWRLLCEETESGEWIPSSNLTDDAPSAETVKTLAKTTAKVESDIEGLQFNTAISALMVLVNHLTALPKRPRVALLHLARILAPFAPHLAEEIHQRLGGQGLVSTTAWPTYRREDLQDKVIELPVQVNSKLRGKILLPPNSTREQIESLVSAHPDFSAWTGGKKVQKVIIVPGRIVNLICP
ncbi:MAG: leucine--tRNA ligase [Verrucomicrobia bacterium]|nr:leucine--tRNA ligase [Verrucomicrobiota bacterium]